MKSKKERDYLQVFELTMEAMMGEYIQKILHRWGRLFWMSLVFGEKDGYGGCDAGAGKVHKNNKAVDCKMKLNT